MTNELVRLEGGVVERAYERGQVTEDPIRLKTDVPLTQESVASLCDVPVRSVWLMGTRHTDRDVELAVKAFPRVAEIHIPTGRAITDDSLRALVPLRDDFRSFTAYRSQVSDEGAMILATFPRLRSIRLDNGRLTDFGLAALAACRELGALQLDGNIRIEGRGLAAFADHPALQVVALSGTKVDDDAVGYFAGCARLERIHLSATRVSERCLLSLPRKPDLDVFLPREVDQERLDEIRRDLPFVVNGLCPEHVIDIPRAVDGTPVELPPQLRGNSLTFAMFTSKSCGPCGWLKTTYGQVRPNLREQFKFVELEVEENLELASALRVRSVPTVFILRFGIELQRFTGACGVEKLTQYLEAALAA